MNTFTKAGDSIEGSKSEVMVRKYSGPHSVDIEGIGTFFKYKSRIRAIVKITEELLPKEYRICKTSKLNKNDSLEGQSLEILTEDRMKFDVISNFSNVHGIQGNKVRCFTFAKIEIPFRIFCEKSIPPAK